MTISDERRSAPQKREKCPAVVERGSAAVEQHHFGVHAVAAGDRALADKLFPETVSIINKAHSAGVLPANTASRRVATISRAYDSLKA